MKLLNKPIFIVGHARGGSTLFGSIVSAHSMVGPKYFHNYDLDLGKLKNYKRHLEFSEKLEQKEIWFKYFKGRDCFTHMGMEIHEKSLNLNQDQIQSLIEELTENFNEERFLSKAPTNSFRIKPIVGIFPDCKIVVILRKGEEVATSWGKRPYGFGKKVDWGDFKISKLSFLKGINIFVKKWQEVLTVVEEVKDLDNVLIITYEDLVTDTKKTLRKTFNFLDLPYEAYLDDINLKLDRNKWKNGLPNFYQYYLLLKVRRGNRKIQSIKQKL